MLRSLKSLGFIQRNVQLQPVVRLLSYESDLSLKKLYPNSRLDLHTPSLPPQKDGKFSGFIPMNRLTVTYSRSSGPGGQNVNKTDTKCDVRFHVQSAEWISEAVRAQFVEKYKNQINKEGFFIVKSDLTRYQRLNLADALERIRNIIRELEGSLEPKQLSPEKLAVIQRRHEKASRERLFRKRERSQIKADRLIG